MCYDGRLPRRVGTKDFEDRVTSDRIYRIGRIVRGHGTGKHPENPVNPV
jgi:hypothetical protein